MTTVAVEVEAVSETQEPRLRRAGFVSRVVADGIDLVIVQLLFFLILFGIAMAQYLISSKPLEIPRPHLALTSAGEFVLAVIYLAWGWASTGRSPGKASLGLRVVTDRGKPLGARRALARAALCVALPVLLFWALVSRRNAGAHDLLLGTAVVYDWQPRRQHPTPAA